MKPNVVSADVLFEEFRTVLKWEWLAGLGASERRFDEGAVRVARSGADLVGHLNYIHPYRIQILGQREVAYLNPGDDAAAGLAQGPLLHEILERGLGLGPRRADPHALARGQAVGLDHDGAA